MDKKRLTKRVVSKEYYRHIIADSRMLILMLLFAFLCITLIPNPFVGWGIGLVVLFLSYRMFRLITKSDPTGNPARSYMRLMGVTAKKEYEVSGGEDSSYYYKLFFGDENGIEVSYNVYRNAEEGSRFYVIFFEKSGKAFRCYSVEDWDPDGSIPMH